MKVEYRQLFLKDLKKLRKQPVYQRIFSLAFEILPNVEDLSELSNVKAMKGFLIVIAFVLVIIALG